MFSLLYKVFYDKTLFERFVKNAKGCGVKILFTLCAFISVLLTFKLFFIFSFDLEEFSFLVAQNLPEIVIEKAEMISPTERYERVFEDKNLFFVLDTTKNVPDFSSLPSSGIYLTKQALFIRNYQDVRRMPFASILKEGRFLLNKENAPEIIEQMIFSLKWIFLPFFFLISIPSLFFVYFFTAFFYACLSFSVTYWLNKTLNFEERMRLAALSLMPAVLLNALSSFLYLQVRLGLLSFLITLIYMYCFLKDPEEIEPSEEPSS